MAAGAALAIGAGVNAFAALFEGEATARAAEYNAQIERLNATIARQNAAEAERRFRRMSKKRMGSMRAARGASGLALDGSALDAMADSAMQEELDALTVRYQGEMQARTHEANARMAEMEAKSARASGAFNAIASLV